MDIVMLVAGALLQLVGLTFEQLRDAVEVITTALAQKL
jgi:hypothetical protein